MKKSRLVKTIAVWITVLGIFLVTKLINDKSAKDANLNVKEKVHLVAVSCGRSNYQGVRDIQKPLDQTITMIKSAVLFAQSPLEVHIFTEDDMFTFFNHEFSSWPPTMKERFKYKLYRTNYDEYLPPSVAEEWRRWYKPCGSFRLLIPLILRSQTNAAIYSDSDVIFVRPISELWQELKSFKPHEVAAVAPTSGHPIRGSKFNENFIYKDDGNIQINSGVMLMNFTRMTSYKWNLYKDEKSSGDNAAGKQMTYGMDLLMTYYRKYKGKAEHDQKLLNILFHYNPEHLRVLSCAWNFKHNFCFDESNTCADAEALGGAKAVHGISSSFFGDVNPTFKSLYESFLKFDFEEDLEKKLLQPFLEGVKKHGQGTFCAKKLHVISRPLKSSISITKLRL